MTNSSNHVTNNREFLIILKRSWPDSCNMFSKEDEFFFKKNLIPFCNSYNEYPLSAGDLQTIFEFLENSLSNSLSQVLEEKSVSDSSKETVSFLLVLFKFLVHHYNQKIITQNFFKKFFVLLLSFPDQLSDFEDVSLIMDFYDSSDLFHCVCHYMTTLILLDVEEDLLSHFMKKARSTTQTRLFRFYLYPFNNRYFRCNYPSFPDECNARELYFGIFYGYFSLTYNSEIYKLLLSMCEEVDNNLICMKNHNNPVYNYYLLSEHNNHLSLMDIYKPLGRLFHD